MHRLEVFGVAGLALAMALGTTASDQFGSQPDDPGEAPSVEQESQWHIRASGVRIIGGYGDNFAYDGENVRAARGTAEMRLDPASGKGKLVIEMETTEESGPVHYARNTRWGGAIRIVQTIDTAKMDAARIATETFLHGDTGNEAPVMPKIYNYFATWGPSKITVNGREAVPMVGSHTMLSEQARGPEGRIHKGDQIYSPKLADKTGFTDADELEFHYVAHTTEPDQENFPPHTGWIHLHFSDVEIVSKPGGVEVPYKVASGQ